MRVWMDLLFEQNLRCERTIGWSGFGALFWRGEERVGGTEICCNGGIDDGGEKVSKVKRGS